MKNFKEKLPKEVSKERLQKIFCSIKGCGYVGNCAASINYILNGPDKKYILFCPKEREIFTDDEVNYSMNQRDIPIIEDNFTNLLQLLLYVRKLNKKTL